MYQCTKSHSQVILPEAICCFDIMCTSVPVRKANTTKFYCPRLFVVVYILVNVVEWYCVHSQER